MEALCGLRAQDVDAAEADAKPSLSAFFNYNGANSYRFVSYGSDWEWHWSSGLSFQWNIWDGGLTRGLVGQKRLELSKARTDLDEMRKNVRFEIKQACLELKYAEETVQAGMDNIGLAEKALEIAGSRHAVGLGTYLEFTDANMALSRAKLSCMKAVCDHMNALANLEHASGKAVISKPAGATK
jgi:outer membrane protein TolC